MVAVAVAVVQTVALVEGMALAFVVVQIVASALVVGHSAVVVALASAFVDGTLVVRSPSLDAVVVALERSPLDTSFVWNPLIP